jgi:hypothetical protein
MKAEDIKPILEKKSCPIHDIHPIVEIAGDEISIMCCCDYFSHYCKIEADFLGTGSKSEFLQTVYSISHN